jgi:hypothetical protein
LVEENKLFIGRSQNVVKGKCVEAVIGKKVVKIFTWHALDSMQDYCVSLESVLDYLLFAQELVKGHGGRFMPIENLTTSLREWLS